MSDHGLKEPSSLPFESPRTRVSILTSYLVLVVLALPLWWSTTSIERLSLPVSRVDALGGKEVSFNVKWLFCVTI
jgi:GPI-anchor transamidase subunit S